MTFLTIIALLVIGLLMLLIGFVTKKRLLIFLSLIPLVISLSQLIFLVVMSLQKG